MRCLRGPEEMCNLMAARRQILWQGTDDLRAWLRSAGYVAFIPLTVTLGNLPAWQVKIGEWVEISGTQAGGARSCKFLWQGLRLSGWIILSHHCALVSLFFFFLSVLRRMMMAAGWVAAVNVLVGDPEKDAPWSDYCFLHELRHNEDSHECTTCPNENLKMLWNLLICVNCAH